MASRDSDVVVTVTNLAGSQLEIRLAVDDSVQCLRGRVADEWGVLPGQVALFSGQQRLPPKDRASDWGSGPFTALLRLKASMTAVSGSREGGLRCWDLETGLCSMALQEEGASVNCMASDFSAMRLVTGSDDGLLRLWDLESGENLQELRGHSDCVMSVAADFNVMKAVSGSDDGTLIYWDLRESRCLQELIVAKGRRFVASVCCVDADFTGMKAISGSADNFVRRLSCKPQRAHSQAASDYDAHLMYITHDSWQFLIAACSTRNEHSCSYAQQL
ncbi:unnamed protein product [Polarella glacialis]|uniref:Uncharacterized protein n=1 Tax=Polarella glacialis TaxID=89957 RepID=A0A813IKF6_POLGL|nr:unnamed protein product [Polarella glacialis]